MRQGSLKVDKKWMNKLEQMVGKFSYQNGRQIFSKKNYGDSVVYSGLWDDKNNSREGYGR
jgi:hypothetical protein